MMDFFQELRSHIEESDSREQAVEFLVARMNMSEEEAAIVLSTKITPALRKAMFPEWGD